MFMAIINKLNFVEQQNVCIKLNKNTDRISGEGHVYAYHLPGETGRSKVLTITTRSQDLDLITISSKLFMILFFLWVRPRPSSV